MSHPQDLTPEPVDDVGAPLRPDDVHMAEAPVDSRAARRAAPRRPSAGFMLHHPARWIALGFGSGLSPVAPGTVGTLWAWLSFVLLQPWLNDLQWLALIAAGTLVGVWACTRTAQHLGVADPGAIVWDEILAFWLILCLVMPVGFGGQLLAFALFRYFDAAKPGPDIEDWRTAGPIRPNPHDHGMSRITAFETAKSFTPSSATACSIIFLTSKNSGQSSILPASILERSSTSSTS